MHKSAHAAGAATREHSFLLPLILVTSLFFLWGLAYGLLDVLNKYFQDTLNITKQRSTLLQAAYFGAYFLMAIPAGKYMEFAGYKKGIIAGLILYAIGAFLFFPSATISSFNLFLISLFILASGLTFLETAANPYVTVLGSQAGAAFRLNLSQSFNGVGAFLGPIIGGSLFFANEGDSAANLDSVKSVYLVIGFVVLLIAGFFVITKLPEVGQGNSDEMDNAGTRPLLAFSHFRWAVITQFFYIAAQVGCAALFINYCTEKGLGIDSTKAAYLLSGALLLFTIGRFAGTFLMKFVRPNILLSFYAGFSILMCAVVIYAEGLVTIYALMAIFFFSSIMFPTIFALGVSGLGRHTKAASSFIIMSIAGGAIAPFVMGSFESTAMAYVVPFFCYVVVLCFGTFGFRIRKNGNAR